MSDAFHCRLPDCQRPSGRTWTWDTLYDHVQHEHGLDKDQAHAHLRQLEFEQRERALQRQAGLMFSSWTLDSFPADDLAGRAAVNAARQWIGADHLTIHWHPRIYLFGPPGTGKSGLAFGIARTAIKEMFVEWVNVRQLLADAKSAMSRGGTFDVTQHPALGYLADIVVLDDLGAERPTPFTIDVIAYLVEQLHLKCTTLITTSNYSPAQLATRLGAADPIQGQRIVSRLIDDALKINLDRQDLRARSAA